MENVMEKVKAKRILRPVLGVLAGAITGWTYYFFVGSAIGSYPILQNPGFSMLFGALMGALVTKRP